MLSIFLRHNLINFISVVFLLVILTSPAQAQVRWVSSSLDQPVPGGALAAGVELSGDNHGKTLYVCRAKHDGGLILGKLIGGQCNIPFGGKEIEYPNYEVAIYSGGSWGKPRRGYTDAFIGGEYRGRPLYLCRARFITPSGFGQVDHGQHSGTVVNDRCNIGFGGNEEVLGDFEVFYPSERSSTTNGDGMGGATNPPDDPEPGSGQPSTCMMVNTRGSAWIHVFVENKYGRKGRELYPPFFLKKDFQVEINSPNGRLRYDYRLDETETWRGDIGGSCNNNNINVP